jgi:GNAT superfamily N-acetyltransferase
MTIPVAPLTGTAFADALPDLARLRMTVFRDWPYLYDGTLEYEQGYLRRFSESPGAVIVAASDWPRIVGAATASPMVGHADAFAEPFRARGYDVSRIFYFGESVLLREYRGRGIGHAFFDRREAHARSLGGYTHTTFCAVVRPPDHPMKPPDYVPLDAFWQRRGYTRMEGLVGSYAWRDIGDKDETAKPMQFWMKAL